MQEPVTRRIKDFREQDKYFKRLEHNQFKRVHLMAADIRRKIDIEYKEEEVKRNERHEVTLANRKMDPVSAMMERNKV